jgi:hypothetical protein
MNSTVLRLILLVPLVCCGLACDGGQSSGESTGSVETGMWPTETLAPRTSDQFSNEKNDAHVALPDSSEGGSSIAAPSIKGLVAKDGTEQQSTSESMLHFFDPTKDGFSFANFRGGSGSSAIGVDDLVELFGSDGLCIPGNSGLCEPYPGVQLFLGQLNAILANGLCYGISASVANHFSGDLILGGIGPETEAVVELNRSDGLDHSIAKLHMMQFSEEYRNALDTYLDDRPEEIAKELITSFKALGNKLTPPYTLALYTDEGGHAITPIGIEETEFGYRVFVYDSNWPKETRWLDIDGDSWEYQGSAVLIAEGEDSAGGLWTGKGAGSMALLPHALPSDGFRCFFCQKAGTGLSKSTGSVIMVNALDMKNTVFELASDDGQTMTWTTSGRSGGLDHVKTYILPSDSESSNAGGDILMVVVPDNVNYFKANLSLVNGPNEDSNQVNSFGMILVGSGVPTTVAKGRILEEPEVDSTSIMEFSKDFLTDTVVLSIDSKEVETVESATMQSAIFVALSSEERYEVTVIEDLLDDVAVIQKETEETVYSLKTVLQDVETPLRITAAGDGLRFSKFENGSVAIESSDNDVITKAADAGYAVAFSDGTTAHFEMNESKSMVGIFSDGSRSIRFQSGNGVHSTADGWIINEAIRGEYEVFRENAMGKLEKPSLDTFSQSFTIQSETKQIMRRLIVDEESRRDPNGEIRLNIEGGSSTVVVAHANTERMAIINDKYELLQRVKEATAVEAPAIEFKEFIRVTLESMGTEAWSAKIATEQEAKLEEMVAAAAKAQPEAKAEAEARAAGFEAKVSEAKAEAEARAAEREAKRSEAKAEAETRTAENEAKLEEMVAVAAKAQSEAKAEAEARATENEAKLEEMATAAAKAQSKAKAEAEARATEREAIQQRIDELRERSS